MPSFIFDRRAALAGAAGLVFAGAGADVAFGARTGERKLVLVILRGALDGLAAVPPYADPQLRRLREHLVVAAPGSADGALELVDGFGLHPRLAFLHESWRANQLAILHAAATPYRDRSHFDGQDVLESGAAGVFALDDGWLNRALNAGSQRRTALALAPTIPLVLRGATPVASYSPSAAQSASEDTIARLQKLYAEDALLGPALAEAVATAAIIDESGMSNSMSDVRRAQRGAQAVKLAMETAAKLMIAPDGPAASVIGIDGWDTHAGQGAAEGQLATRLVALDTGLAALKQGLGAHWNSTVVIVASEFGRTVAENGTRGTDHGTGGVAFALGGAVKGGRMLGDWPGLSRLYENRDLIPANDIRALFAGALVEHWGVDRAAIASTVFPDRPPAPLAGLIA